MQIENTLRGKYTLDVHTPGKVIVTPNDPEFEPIEINVPGNYILSKPYLVRFCKQDDKYIMMTDVNGACSEVYVDISKVSPEDPIKDVYMNTDYLYFSFVTGEDDNEPKPVYVQLSDLVDVSELDKHEISPELENCTIVQFDENEEEKGN